MIIIFLQFDIWGSLRIPVLFSGNAHEAIWKDKANNLSYALSSIVTGFNEINVGSFTEGQPIYGTGFTFYGQYNDRPAVTKTLGLISYNVTGLGSGQVINIGGAGMTLNSKGNGSHLGLTSVASGSSYSVVVSGSVILNSQASCTVGSNGTGLMPTPAQDFTVDIMCMDNRP